MMAAEVLSEKHEVHLYEQGKRLGRKFLVAGKGGFNLTNSLQNEALYAKYNPQDFLKTCLQKFGSQDTRDWLEGLDIPTFIGTSGRVFPERDIKPTIVLQKWTERLLHQGVHFHYHHSFIGFDTEAKPVIRHAADEFVPPGDRYVFALGGASWSKTGSKGDWLDSFANIGIATVPFQSSNCGLNIDWPAAIRNYHAGKPLKNIQVSVLGQQQKGEALLTDYGIEGNAIYPIVSAVRTLLNRKEQAFLSIDFKPKNTEGQLLQKLKQNTKAADYGRTLNLDRTQLALLKAYTTKAEYLDATAFVEKIKKLSLPIQSLRPIEEAISTVGGIAIKEVNENFSLKRHPHLYVIGEMLDWDAPTGGFLLQGCFAMGAFFRGEERGTRGGL